MPRLSIDEFRARLSGRADAGPLLRAYRELARRTEVRAAIPGRFMEWAYWTGAAAVRAP